MTRKTITQIMGEYGLPANSSSTIFSDLEKSITESTKSILDELRSSQLEQYAGQGLGLSSFAQQAINKQEKDVMGQVATNLAGFKTGLLGDLLKMEASYAGATESELDKIRGAGEAQSLSQIENLFTSGLLAELEKASKGEKSELLLPYIGAVSQLPTYQSLSGSLTGSLGGFAAGALGQSGYNALMEALKTKNVSQYSPSNTFLKQAISSQLGVNLDDISNALKLMGMNI